MAFPDEALQRRTDLCGAAASGRTGSLFLFRKFFQILSQFALNSIRAKPPSFYTSLPPVLPGVPSFGCAELYCIKHCSAVWFHRTALFFRPSRTRSERFVEIHKKLTKFLLAKQIFCIASQNLNGYTGLEVGTTAGTGHFSLFGPARCHRAPAPAIL